MKSLVGVLFSALLVVGCSSEYKRTGMGAGIGAAAGGVLGAVIGHQSGNRNKGAAIGAVLGGAAGAGIGYKLDQQAKELAAIAETKRTEQGILTKLKGDILFSSGASTLKPESTQRLTQMATIIRKYPGNRLTVVGHTDSQGSNSFNQTLSEQRANAVRSLFVTNGVPATAIQTIGAGETQPVGSNTTKDGRSQNRRVEIAITMVEEPEAKK